MLYKNMVEICRLPNTHLKLFATLCTDQSLLQKLSKGFPELFTDTKPEQDGPIPLSALQEVALGLDEEHTFDEVSGKYGLPSFSCAHPNSNQFQVCRGIPMPQEATAKYTRHAERYKQGKGFPFDLSRITISGVDYYIGWVNPTGVSVDDEKDFYVFPCALVDVNA